MLITGILALGVAPARVMDTISVAVAGAGLNLAPTAQAINAPTVRNLAIGLEQIPPRAPRVSSLSDSVRSAP